MTDGVANGCYLILPKLFDVPPSLSYRLPSLPILSPLVLATDLRLLLRGDVVGDIKRLADLLVALALDHVGDCLASNVQEVLDIHVVRRLYLSGQFVSPQDRTGRRTVEVTTHEDDLKKNILVHLHELLIPLIDVRCLLTQHKHDNEKQDKVLSVMLAPLDHLAQDR